MNSLFHWQPILPANQLGGKPVGIRIDGHELVLFRGQNGTLGGLPNQCPHRRMKLDQGWVEGDRLVCPYHALELDAEGRGYSPHNPKYQPCVQAYDVVERWGAIWVKDKRSEARLPPLDEEGLFNCTRPAYDVVNAPLELCLDNFAEVEHAATTHLWFGYGRKELANVTQDVSMDDETITVRTLGVQREVSLPMRTLFGLFGLRSGDLFEDVWTHHFSPVHTVYRHRWLDPHTKEARPRMRFRFAIFMTPLDDDSTAIFSFLYLPQELKPLRRILEPIQLRISEVEVRQDRNLLESLADKSTDLRGMKLGRFDKNLGEIRKRLDVIYRAGRVAATR